MNASLRRLAEKSGGRRIHAAVDAVFAKAAQKAAAAKAASAAATEEMEPEPEPEVESSDGRRWRVRTDAGSSTAT